MNLLTSLRSEILKTKRTASFYLTIFAAAVIPIIFLLNVISDGLEATQNDPFNAVFKLGGQMVGLVIFPIYVILICTLLPQIEYRNNTWKQVLTSPQPKSNVFLAKFLNIQLLTVVFLVAYHLFMLLAAVATHFILPELDLLHRPLNGYALLQNSVTAYVAILAVSALQFWIGLRFRNFIAPIAIGLGLWLAGTLLVVEYKSNYAKYFPYSFHVFVNFPAYKVDLNSLRLASTGYAVLFTALGFLDFRRRRMNN